MDCNIEQSIDRSLDYARDDKKTLRATEKRLWTTMRTLRATMRTLRATEKKLEMTRVDTFADML